MNEAAAVDALKRLGLTTYEARVFVALQKLGTGTASEIAGVADVPRSQVYGAADDLEDRGLVDVQQSDPTRYRPVDVEEARERLYRQLRSESDAAFDYLESIESEAPAEEESESIWTVRGSENVASRAAQLIESADSAVQYGTDDVDYLEPVVRDALADAAKGGAGVVVVSADDAVLEVVDELGVDTVPVGERKPEMRTGRVLMVDQEAVLISVRGDTEAAFWSRDTGFATMLSTLLEEFTASVARK
ncbi:MAG: TrmB family transcriptional regulator [Halobacterium sp.]